jgi:hypothetical protein
VIQPKVRNFNSMSFDQVVIVICLGWVRSASWGFLLPNVCGYHLLTSTKHRLYGLHTIMARRALMQSVSLEQKLLQCSCLKERKMGCLPVFTQVNVNFPVAPWRELFRKAGKEKAGWNKSEFRLHLYATVEGTTYQ